MHLTLAELHFDKYCLYLSTKPRGHYKLESLRYTLAGGVSQLNDCLALLFVD